MLLMNNGILRFLTVSCSFRILIVFMVIKQCITPFYYVLKLNVSATHSKTLCNSQTVETKTSKHLMVFGLAIVATNWNSVLCKNYFKFIPGESRPSC